LGIDLPIIQAPIGGATCPELVSAVSNSGGLGMLSITWRQPEEIPAAIAEIRALTDKPFGVNLVIDKDVHAKLEAALAEGIRIVSLFWGDPDEYVNACHDAGALVMHTVGNVADARAAVKAGVDVIVAQGGEAGGHVCGTVSGMTLVPAIVDAVAPVPVVAAGGIADGRGIAAAHALGASASWLGTRFVASTEALAHQSYKEKLVAAAGNDSVYTELFDVGWENAPHRALRNSTFEEWEKAGSPPSGQRPNEGQVIAHKQDGTPLVRYSVSMPLESMEGEMEGLAHYAGQGVGLVNDILPVSEIMRRLVRETEQAQGKWRG